MFSGVRQLAPLVGFRLDLDSFGANMAPHGCCSLSSTAHSRSASSAPVRLRSLLSRRSVSCLPNDLGKACAHRSAGRLHLGSLLPASRDPGLSWDSSRAPQVSAERVRLSRSIKSRVFSFTRHDVLNVGLSTPHLSSTPFAPVWCLRRLGHALLRCRLAGASELGWEKFPSTI